MARIRASEIPVTFTTCDVTVFLLMMRFPSQISQRMCGIGKRITSVKHKVTREGTTYFFVGMVDCLGFIIIDEMGALFATHREGKLREHERRYPRVPLGHSRPLSPDEVPRFYETVTAVARDVFAVEDKPIISELYIAGRYRFVQYVKMHTLFKDIPLHTRFRDLRYGMRYGLYELCNLLGLRTEKSNECLFNNLRLAMDKNLTFFERNLDRQYDWNKFFIHFNLFVEYLGTSKEELVRISGPND